MKYKTFEDFLKVKFVEAHPKILDDDLPDAFEEWLVDKLLVNDFIDFADEYASIQKQEIVEEIKRAFDKTEDRYILNSSSVRKKLVANIEQFWAFLLDEFNKPLTP